MPKIQIKSWIDERIIHEGEYDDIRAAVVFCVSGGADLSNAFLSNAFLSNADLSDAPTLERIPDFYCNNQTALDDMKRLAELEAARANA